jgi:1-acyl-sn-glycerol-3-phosphate acyltransferase
MNNFHFIMSKRTMAFLFIGIRTIISYILLISIAPFFIIPALIIASLPARYRQDNRLFFLLVYWFFKVVVFLTFNPVQIIGKKNIPHNSPAIFVANHQSALDIPVVGMLTQGYPHVWLVLEYYVNTPILGFFIRRMFVPVNRASKTKAASSLMQLLRLLKERKRDLIIFPEGGRFTDGKIYPFFKGFAVIAQQTGLPVIPVYMPNNGKIYPPYSFLIYSYPIKVIVGEPFYYTEEDTDQTFTEKVRAWFLKKAEQDRPL